MNTKSAIITIALGFATFAAMAGEASDPPIAVSMLSRAQVQADVARAQRDGSLHVGGEATVFNDAVVASTKSLDEAHAEASRFVRNEFFNNLQVGG